MRSKVTLDQRQRDEEQGYFGPVPALSVTETRSKVTLDLLQSAFDPWTSDKKNSSFHLSGTGCECDVRGAVTKEQFLQTTVGVRQSNDEWMDFDREVKAVIFDEIDLTDLSFAECSIKNVNHSFQISRAKNGHTNESCINIDNILRNAKLYFV
uniref:Uncharacterized protein n=1 Tax=Timema shepardi TaxID=629360 RepID=A0A7R9ALH6_TIMSH|nr:unnamed protein product [Timema shepardi]